MSICALGGENFPVRRADWMGWVLHATRCTEGGGDCREDGDYYVEDLTPESVVVESSHFCLDYRVQSTDC